MLGRGSILPSYTYNMTHVGQCLTDVNRATKQTVKVTHLTILVASRFMRLSKYYAKELQGANDTIVDRRAEHSYDL